MKIEKFIVSVAAKDGMIYTEIFDRLKPAIARADCDGGIYAIEFERLDGNAQPEAPQNAKEDAGTAACDGVKVRRIQSKGEVVEMRGNCQGGYAKAEVN